MSKVIKFPENRTTRHGNRGHNDKHMTYHVDFKAKQITKVELHTPEGDVIQFDRRASAVKELNKKVG